MAELVYHVAVSLDNFIADQAMLDGNINQSFSYLKEIMSQTFYPISRNMKQC